MFQISVPNPFFEGRNRVYVIPEDPVTLIDTGVATEKAYEALCAGLAEHGLRVDDIRRVILTHKHIDHIGNAWRIQRAGGAEIFIHQSECKSVTDVDPTGTRFADLINCKLEEWQVPQPRRPETKESMPLWQLESAEVTGVVDGHAFEFESGCLRVVHTPGHTMGSICLVDDQRIFSGDHVLEEISPNIGGGDMRSRGMLGHFMTSLQRVSALGDLETLPGHGQVFRGLAARCQQLIHHHEQRLSETQQALHDGPKSVFEVATHLFGPLDDIHLVLGCAEANAHLELLIERQLIQLTESANGEQPKYERRSA